MQRELPQGVSEYRGPQRFSKLDGSLDISPEHRKSILGVSLMPGRDFNYARLKSPTEHGAIDVFGSSGARTVSVLVCRYEFSNFEKTMKFWTTPRPMLDNKSISLLKASFDTSPFADVTVTECPKTWGEALTTGFGKDFLDQAIAANKQVWQDKEDSSNAAQKRQAEKFDRERNWMKGAQPRHWARDSQTISALETSISEVLTRRKDIDPHRLPRVIMEKVDPLMLELGRSAVGNATRIPKGEAGRTRFEEWDRTYGQAIVRLNLKLQTPLVRGSWMESMSYRVWFHTIDSIYKEQLEDKGAFSLAYTKSLLAGADKLRDQSTAKQKIDPNDIRSARIYTLRPRQTLMYRVMSGAVEGATALAATHARNKEYVASLTRELARARTEFWSCARQQCTDGGPRWVAYSKLLVAKDKFYAVQYYMEAMSNRMGSPNGAMMNELMGISGDVDGGMITGCETEYSNYLGGIGTLISSGGSKAIANPAALDSAINGEEFLQVQQCRDRMEFILRPRGT